MYLLNIKSFNFLELKKLLFNMTSLICRIMHQKYTNKIKNTPEIINILLLNKCSQLTH